MSTEPAQATLPNEPIEPELAADPPPIETTGALEEPPVVIVDRATGELVPAASPEQAVAGTSLAPYDPNRVSLSDIAGIARTLAQSGYFDDAKSSSQAFAKILAGQEMGIGPFRALKEVRIIKGSPTLSAPATAALIKRSDEYDYKVVDRSDERCEIEFYEYGKPVGTVVFTIEDAKRADLVKPNSSWTRYPRRMLFARAITEGATTFCPDIFGAGGVYTPEELGADEADA